MATLSKAAPRTFTHEPNVPDRRHSVAHSAGGTASARKTSDTPSWLAAMNERNHSTSSDPGHSHSSGLKGLFGHKKEKMAQPKMVLTSKHAGQLRNILRADPRGARKHPSGNGKTAGGAGVQHGAHVSPAQMEQRLPHSGPPAQDGMPMLSRIVSGDEEDIEDKNRLAKWVQTNKVTGDGPLEKVQEVSEHRASSATVQVGEVLESDGRRKSLMDVEMKAADSPRRKRNSVWGGWRRDDKGNWTR